MLLTSIDGVQREIKELWHGKDGVKTETKEMWAGVDGVNKQIFSEIRYDPVLDNNTWEMIRQASDEGVAESIWSVGDRKGTYLNGSVAGIFTLNKFYCYPYIIGFNHNKQVEGDNTTTFEIGNDKHTGGNRICFVDNIYGGTTSSGFTGFSMNVSATNDGGWKYSYMREQIIYDFKNLFEAELKTVLKEVKKYSTASGSTYFQDPAIESNNESVFLLSEKEYVGDSDNISHPDERRYQQQYAFYKVGNERKKKKYNTVQDAIIWTRSNAISSSPSYFVTINDFDIGYPMEAEANISYGISPAFVV